MLKTFSGRRASQNEQELRGFISLLQSEGVTRYLEVGAREGDTFHEVMTSLPAGAVGVALDLPGGNWGHKSTRLKLERAVVALQGRGYAASCLFGDSRSDATRRLAAGRGPYDAILLDGDHTLVGVTADWDNYRAMGRLIAFHDIVGAGQMDKRNNVPVEVPTLWASIKASGVRYMEFIAPDSTMGIGVVWTR